MCVCGGVCVCVLVCVLVSVCVSMPVCVCVKHLLDGSANGYSAQSCLAQQQLSDIPAEGARAPSVTLSGGALFASLKLLQFPSSLIVKVILAICMRALAQQLCRGCQCIMPLVAQ